MYEAMTWLDRLIQKMRIYQSLKFAPDHLGKVFDIGCDDCTLYSLTSHKITSYWGCDPKLSTRFTNDQQLFRGHFPEVVDSRSEIADFDVVFALAVFEHFTLDDLNASAKTISQMLGDGGQLIVTVPHPKVDLILRLLLSLRLIHAQSFDEHHGFDPSTLESMFQPYLQLSKKHTFQFGLNNLFVFTKRT